MGETWFTMRLAQERPLHIQQARNASVIAHSQKMSLPKWCVRAP